MWVEDFIGLTFKDKGRDYDGIDCWGLVYLAYRDHFGIDLPDYQHYSSSCKPREVNAVIDEGRMDWAPLQRLEDGDIGDLVVFRMKNIPTHVGLFVSVNDFVHIEKGTNCVLERFVSPVWANRLEGIYRHVKR